jgi:hypothetical protein
MAEDRHEAYRYVYGSMEINNLFKRYDGKHSPVHITYILLQIKHANPTSTVRNVIEDAKKYLDGIR